MRVVPGGFYQRESGRASCPPCVPGKYQRMNGVACELCAINHFANETAMTSCHLCPIGTEAVRQGATLCSACPAGRFGEAGPTCTGCVAGRFREAGAASALSCESCPRVSTNANQVEPRACLARREARPAVRAKTRASNASPASSQRARPNQSARRAQRVASLRPEALPAAFAGQASSPHCQSSKHALLVRTVLFARATSPWGRRAATAPRVTANRPLARPRACHAHLESIKASLDNPPASTAPRTRSRMPRRRLLARTVRLAGTPRSTRARHPAPSAVPAASVRVARTARSVGIVPRTTPTFLAASSAALAKRPQYKVQLLAAAAISESLAAHPAYAPRAPPKCIRTIRGSSRARRAAAVKLSTASRRHARSPVSELRSFSVDFFFWSELTPSQLSPHTAYVIYITQSGRSPKTVSRKKSTWTTLIPNA